MQSLQYQSPRVQLAHRQITDPITNAIDIEIMAEITPVLSAPPVILKTSGQVRPLQDLP